jgi:hypothetical protein
MSQAAIQRQQEPPDVPESQRPSGSPRKPRYDGAVTLGLIALAGLLAVISSLPIA